MECLPGFYGFSFSGCRSEYFRSLRVLVLFNFNKDGCTLYSNVNVFLLVM